ncbi:OOP family OmpA-OmpF porin [Povalibacter uvarum]|uniref:OOP family OmpA-OmpF porin n=1 Tax=Povalibacter uvarum TaxID=732238 RepID=A0A841HFZ8_9GAMM|nr:outer membrane beta-barrel protein [Povalibacter uvarum]MBB6091696.1 OOP family OmpA-OmpF porin [Povalibacter uvarum]
MLASLCVCGLASNAAAREPEAVTQYPSAAYFGGEAGALYYDNACEANALSCDDTDVTAAIFGGYRFNPYLALELSYRDLGEAHATYPRLTSTLDVTGQMRGYGLDVQVSLPINDTWLAYVRGGAFYSQAETRSSEFQAEEDEWAPAAGAGIAWQFRPNWQARIQYLFLSGVGGADTGESNAEIVSLGLSYFFGQHTKPAPEPAAIVPATSPPPPPTAAPELPLCAPPLPAWTTQIYFAFNSDEPLAMESLIPLMDRMQRHPQTTVRIAGFADSSGPSGYNLALSQRRALAVAERFRARGIESNRIVVGGFGESEVDTGTGSVRDALSRRVNVTSPAVRFENGQCRSEKP